MSKIEVGGYIFNRYFGTDYGHTFVRYTSDSGQRYVIRAGSTPEETGIDINFEINVPWENSVDNPENSIHGTINPVFRDVVLEDGQDTDAAWLIMIDAARSLQNSGTDYLIFWNNCQAVVRSTLNAVGFDALPLQNQIANETGGSYPNYTGIINETYGLGGSLLGRNTDDILRGADEKDNLIGSEGSDEIYGFSLEGNTEGDTEDSVAYQLVQGSVTLGLNLDPSAEALVTKSTGNDILYGIEKYFLTTENDTLVVSGDGNISGNTTERFVDFKQGIDIVDVANVPDNLRVDLSKLDQQTIELRNSPILPIEFANAELARTGDGEDIVLGPDQKNTAAGADPLVLDLDGGGLDLSGLSLASPRFDIDGDGFAERTGWIAEGSALLARDLNGDDRINSVNELFGTNTESGFAQLSDLDTAANGGNEDGVINVSDTGFSDLRVWVDEDADGWTDPDELVTLSSLGITEFDLATSDPIEGEERINGNTVTAVSTFTRSDGSTGTLADVAFVYETAGIVDNDGDGQPDDGSENDEDPDGEGIETVSVIHSGVHFDFNAANDNALIVSEVAA